MTEVKALDKIKVINKVKTIYSSIRIANIHPTGVLATRALVLTMLVPILLVITQYIMAFISGYVSDEANKLISVGINIIDHIFIPSVLTALVGFLALWIDKDKNGVPDKLEESNTIPMNRQGIQQLADDVNHDERGK